MARYFVKTTYTEVPCEDVRVTDINFLTVTRLYTDAYLRAFEDNDYKVQCFKEHVRFFSSII